MVSDSVQAGKLVNLALSPERQSARMSKIKNGGLDQYRKV